MENKTPDRRKAQRIPACYTVHSFRHGLESVSQEKITGVLRDISGSGLSFLSEGGYAPGELLDLQIDLPASQHHLLVRVARVEVLGESKIIGAYFVDMSSQHEKALMEALFTYR